VLGIKAGAADHEGCVKLSARVWVSMRNTSFNAVVAQLVEQALRKRQVGGSTPSNGTKIINDLHDSSCRSFLFFGLV
jgi:hypothetical protein